MSDSLRSPYVLYYGEDTPPPPRLSLRAGPLTLLYEAGELRYIKLGHQEVIRRVYVAVRDRNWGTVPATLSNVEVDQSEDAFRITLAAVHQQAGVQFAWRGTITGESGGSITFTMDGEARSTFLRNRIGFCVLHPPQVAGTACRLTHVDGAAETSHFPVEIAPQRVENGGIHPVYPFADLRALAHAVVSGVWAEVQFEGEIFEMEDQRNWIDGSFKTYSTPLRLPFPVEIQAGTRLWQQVRLRVMDDGGSSVGGFPESRTTDEGRRVAAGPAATGQDGVQFEVQTASSSLSLPRLGLGLAGHGQPLTPREVERLRALHLSHLRLDLTPSGPEAPARLRQATSEAQALGVGLEVALFLSDDAENELRQLRGWLAELGPPIAAWLIFHQTEKTTGERWLRLARTLLKDTGAPIISGVNVYFTELNRQRPAVEWLDGVCYSVNPQVHAFDNASLVETAQVIATTVTSAHQFSGGRPIVVSPVTLRPRFNPNATAPDIDGPPGLPPQVDPRQMSLLGAGWTLASLKYLAESGAASATYYETTGWRGVMETEAGSPLPDHFPSPPGAVFPLYHVLADVGESLPASVLPSQSSDPLRVDGLALRRGEQTRLLLANLGIERQRVVIQGARGLYHVRRLDETNALRAMHTPEEYRAEATVHQAAEGRLELELGPYAIVRLDSV